MPCRAVDLRGVRLVGAAAVLVFAIARTSARADTTPGDDLVVVSDLHLGEGVPSPLEDFTIDQAFSDFVDYLIADGIVRGSPAKVVFNGDTFDFLKVLTPPAGEAFPTTGEMATAARDIKPTQAVAMQKMRRIIEAHPRFFDALGKLARNGHPLIFIAGNHDQELAYSPVRRMIREDISARAGARITGRAIRFNPHFHLHGPVLIEHGQRYESANAVHAMNWPFTNEPPRERRLRPAASNYLVVEAANPLRSKLPHITQLRRGVPQLMAALTGAPESIPSWVLLLVKMAFRVEREAPAAEAQILRRHLRILRAQIGLNNMPAQVNETRKRKGLPPLTGEQLLADLIAWDRLAALPWLRGPEPVANPVLSSAHRLAEALRRVSPRSLREWTHADTTSRVREGQDFAGAKLARVIVGGHTHKAGLRQLGDAGPIFVNSGTWTTIVPERGGKIDPLANLTFVEVRKGVPALRRWDARRRQPAAAERTWPPRRAR